jgi:hypothetical protein
LTGGARRVRRRSRWRRGLRTLERAQLGPRQSRRFSVQARRLRSCRKGPSRCGLRGECSARHCLERLEDLSPLSGMRRFPRRWPLAREAGASRPVARLRVGADQADASAIFEQAIEHVKRGAPQWRRTRKGVLFLGLHCKVLGTVKAAEKIFSWVTQIKPECMEARRELRLINLRRKKHRFAWQTVAPVAAPIC